MKKLRAVCILKSMVLAIAIGIGALGVLPDLTSQVAAAEVDQDAPLVVLAKLVSRKNVFFKKLGELSTGTHPVTDPTLDMKQVATHLEKAVSLGREALVQSENDAFVAFKYADSRAKLALARSTYSRSIAPLLASGNLSPNALSRIEEIGVLLEDIMSLFIDTP